MPASTSLAVLALAALSSATTLIGVWAALRLRGRPQWVAAGFAFAATVMLCVAAVELVPRAAEAIGVGPTLAWTAAGAAAATAVAGLVAAREDRRRGPDGDGLSYVVAGTLIFHDVPEGVALALTYQAAASSGVLLAVALAVHNLPEQFAAVLAPATRGQRRALWIVAGATAMAEPVGAVAGLLAGAWLPGIVDAALAVSAGAMIAVCAIELVPTAWRVGPPTWVAGGVLGGGGVFVVLQQLTG